MPIHPQVGRSFEVANGNRAEVQFKLPKPDKDGVLFGGYVKLNGQDQFAGWNNGGICPANHDFNLDSLWPADDTRQYVPILQTPEGVFRPFCQFYAEIGSLRHDWKDRTQWGMKIEKTESGPAVEIIDLSQE